MSKKIPEPLPPDWLPEPVTRVGHGDEDAWESQIRRLMAEAEPTLESYRTGEIGWWPALSRYWQPAAVAALASAAALVLLLGPGSQPRSAPPSGDLALMVAASDGNPAVLWTAIGEDADPVLALIALAEEAR